MTAMYAYRGSQTAESPANDTTHTMWTLNAETALYTYAGENMDRVWRLNLSNATHINDLLPAIAEALREDIEDGSLSVEMDRIVAQAEDEGRDAVEAICAAFAPSNIVDSADAYDNADMVEWLWTRVLDDAGIILIRTEDGAICFDNDLAENMSGESL